MKLKPTILLSFIIIATLIFIWGNSFESFTVSQQISKTVTEVVTPGLEVFIGRGHVTNPIVRKLAHVTEFAILGSGMALLSAARKRRGFQPIFNCLSAGLAVAVIDETIQIFSDRGSSVSDVLIDFAGVCIGIILALLIRRLINVGHRRA